jgi:hypothetical protein
VEFAKAWRDARLASEFINELERRSSDDEALYDAKSNADWLAWARRHLEDFDPSRLPISDICRELMDVTAFQYD